ncbi:hypothetical protein ACLQ8T_16875 (plasmid) [Glutamicibacter sp. FR1]|uniref:hypothetical protein n=1 Tax=Glutamicibacter sp. FR1 TaxID=3393744 RepID=UPI0039B07DB6
MEYLQKMMECDRHHANTCFYLRLDLIDLQIKFANRPSYANKMTAAMGAVDTYDSVRTFKITEVTHPARLVSLIATVISAPNFDQNSQGNSVPQVAVGHQ